MDPNYYSRTELEQNYNQAQSRSKVYINPNFQRNISSNIMPSSSVHINPLFQQQPIIQPTVNKSRIHVNPKFANKNIAFSAESQYCVPSIPPVISQVSSIPTVITGVSSIPTVISHCNYYPDHNTNNYAAISNSYYYETSNSNDLNYSTAQVNNQYCVPNSTLTTTFYPQSVCSSSSNFATTSQNTLPSTTPLKVSNKITNVQSTPVTKSRYAIVRRNSKNNVKTPKSSTQVAAKIQRKVKISKYKTVTIDEANKSIPTKKTTQVVAFRGRENYANSLRPNNIYKIVRPSVNQTKRLSQSSSQTKIDLKTLIRKRHSLNNSLNKKYKLNNIPCPQYKKFGKCLRSEKGKCELLHDKKHVSICRQFLKGACHNKECLLSHELTAKKMPTCYFYLKGMCTKDDCPYLHVKLNDKAKICTDFLKGYCEKGDKCLNRHINICPDLASKGKCSKRQCSYSHGRNKNMKVVNTNKCKPKTPSPSFKLKLVKRKIRKSEGLDKEMRSEEELTKQNEQELTKDSRYYKEVADSTSDTGLNCIKPLRVKLGDLPSYIGL